MMSGFVQRKKQTLLAPLGKKSEPNAVTNDGELAQRSKKKASSLARSAIGMSIDKERNVIEGGNFCYSESSSEESEMEMIKSCEKTELNWSQEHNSAINTESVCCNLFKNEDNLPGSDETDVRFSASLQNNKNLTNGNKDKVPDNMSPSTSKSSDVFGGFSSSDSESELEIIQSCEKAELTLSQEKRLKLDDERWLETDDGKSEMEIIRQCEQAELSHSQKNKTQQLKAARACKNLCNEFSCSANRLETISEIAENPVNKTELASQQGRNYSWDVSDIKVDNAYSTRPKKRKRVDDVVDCVDVDNTVFPVSKSSSQQKSSDNLPKNSVDSQNMFGLFGVSSSDEDELGEMLGSYFAKLPDEILENIFCQLPLIDLLLNLSLVCKRWHRIISCKKFSLWKKRYYHYKYVHEGRAEVNKLIAQAQLNCKDIFPKQLCRFLTSFRTPRPEHADLTAVLKSHSQYHLIEKFIQQNDVQPGSCWSVVGLLSLVANSVYDIQEIISCLSKSRSFFVHDILECLYCLALIFFALAETRPGHFSSHHYRIYYALYLSENTSHCTQSSLKSAYGANKSGQQSILKYRETSEKTWLTHEQVRIMNHNTEHGDVLKIVAFAGTGKTTTLVEYTKLRPSWKFLNVAYNNKSGNIPEKERLSLILTSLISVQENAQQRFPVNVESRTVHSLAFRAVGFRYRGKMAPSIRVGNVIDNISEKHANYLHAKRIVDTLTNYISSHDIVISCEHVPYLECTSMHTEGEDEKQKYFNSEKYKMKVVRDAKDIWEKMSDPGNRDVKITHDGYLKLFQLSKPVIRKYDCILVDEAQDCTPAVADILLNQKVAKILVGDPHQQIYSFRGATNAMAQVEATHVYYLTQSFRFGSEIASVASSVLNVLKGVRSKNIVGISRPGGFHGDHVGQIAVICRTNFALFNNAAQKCVENNKIRIGFAGGIQGYNLKRILDIYKLFVGCDKSGIKDKFIQRFKSFAELKAYANKAPDVELSGKIKIVETHNTRIPEHVKRIEQQYCSDADHAEIIFSTAHKSKGLEFDTVRLGEDFLSGYESIEDLRDAPTDEKNLLYVAVTRAKHRLQFSTTLYELLTARTDLLLTCESLNLLTYFDSTYCGECKRLCDYSESLLVVKQSQIVLGSTQKINGGALCVKCACELKPHLSCFLRGGKKT